MDVSQKFEELGKRLMSLSEDERKDIQYTVSYVCRYFLDDETFHDLFLKRSPEHRVQNLAALQHIVRFNRVEIQDREPFDEKATPYSNLTSLMSLLSDNEVKIEHLVGIPLCLLGYEYLDLPANFSPLLHDLPCNEVNKIFTRIKSHPLKLINDELPLRNTVLFLAYGGNLIHAPLVNWALTREASQLIQNIVNAYTHTTSESERLQIEAAMAIFLRALRDNEEWESQWKDSESQWLENLANTLIQGHSLSRKDLVSAIEAVIIKRHRGFLNLESRKQFGIENGQDELEEISGNLMCSGIALDKEQTENGDKIDRFWNNLFEF